MTEQERWLDANTIKCDRFNAKMTPGACNDYRRANPERCAGCTNMAADPAKVVQWGSEERAVKAQQLEQPKRKDPVMNKIRRECAKCKEEKTITGRGLCSKCYHQEHKAGTLDQNYPSTFVRLEAEAVAQPEPSPQSAAAAVPEEELATAILELLFPNGIAPRHLMLGLEVAKDVTALLTKTWGMR